MKKLTTEIIEHNSKKVFNFIPGNRAVSSQHVNEMSRAVSNFGCLRSVICVMADFVDGTGVKKRWIVDGQHLYNALVKLEQPIPVIYVQVDDMDELIKLMAELNSSARPWGLADYVNLWCSSDDKKDYHEVRRYKLFYNYSYSTVLMACNHTKFAKISQEMKEGRFKIANKTLTVEILENLQKVFEIIPKRYKSEISAIVGGYIHFYVAHRENYKHSRLLDAIRVNQVPLANHVHSVPSVKDFLTQIYKAGTSKKNTVVVVPTRHGTATAK